MNIIFKYLTLICIAIVITSCNTSPKANNTSESNVTILDSEFITITKEQLQLNHMTFGKISEQQFSESIQSTGIIDVPPQNKAVVSSFIAGYVKNTPLLVGDKVKKGQLLLTIENPEIVEIQQEYLEIAQQLTFLESEFNRQKTLVEEQITSKKNFLKAESNYKSQLAKYNGLKKKLQMLHINIEKVNQGQITSTINLYAPIHGSITQINISKGTYISPADVIMEIINTDHIHLELTVFEKDILQIKKGQKIQFNLPEASKNKFNAEVYLVGTSIDPIKRTAEIHGHIDENSNQVFAVGMFVDAKIYTESKKEWALPEEAVIESGGKHFVLIKENETNKKLNLIQKEVTVGETTDGYVSLLNLNDLNEETAVLISGAFNLIGEQTAHEH